MYPVTLLLQEQHLYDTSAPTKGHGYCTVLSRTGSAAFAIERNSGDPKADLEVDGFGSIVDKLNYCIVLLVFSSDGLLGRPTY